MTSELEQSELCTSSQNINLQVGHTQWRIQDFPQGGAPTPKIAIIFHIFAENCMKMKEFGSPGGGARPWRPPLDPPMIRCVKLASVSVSVSV